MKNHVARYRDKTLIVKAYEIFSIDFTCDFCTKDIPCCDLFEVLVTEEEAACIDRILDTIALFCPWIKIDGGFDNVFDHEANQNRLWILEKDDKGHCPFEYIDSDQKHLCGIHSAALTLGENPFFRKPLVCSLWPLAFYEDEKRVVLEVDSELEGFHCIKKEKREEAGSGIINIIEDYSYYFRRTRYIDKPG